MAVLSACVPVAAFSAVITPSSFPHPPRTLRVARRRQTLKHASTRLLSLQCAHAEDHLATMADWHSEDDLPPILLSNVPGTWAYDTMTRRIRETILSKIFIDNAFTGSRLERLQALDMELQNAATSLLKNIEDNGPDSEAWASILAPYADKSNWLDTPWLYAEFYFYRRVMEAIDYFETPYDPFALEKAKGLTSARPIIETLTVQLHSVVDLVIPGNGVEEEEVRNQLELFVMTSLWGNRMDLSLWPAGGDESRAANAFGEALSAGGANLLASDLDKVANLLMSLRASGGKRIDIIVDNAGFELLSDLCLADILVTSGCAKNVVLQLKGHPTFVSDAMSKDVLATVEFLLTLGGDSALTGVRWQEHIEKGAWVLKEDFFWAQPTPFWEMPQEVADDVHQAALVFQKGDANYRRLLGDRDWDLDKPFTEVAGYFPAPLCALRTLKAELGCGMPPASMERAKTADPDWLTSGRWGVVHSTL